MDTTTLIGEWTQVSGDVHASEYGATFAQLDTCGDTVYGVNVVEIINMVEACGSDYDVKREGGAYVTEESYVDVDGMELSRTASILESMGIRDTDNTPEYPESVQERVNYLLLAMEDMRKLAAWNNTPLTEMQQACIDGNQEELAVYRKWYSIPRLQRAEMAHIYGGYRSGQSLTFASLREAMEYHYIPASALWRAEEYDAIPDDCKVGVRLRRGSLGYHDDSGTYYAEYTQDDGVYQYNLADVTECPQCEHDVSDMDVLETCPVCGGNFEEVLATKCCECDKPVFKGWQCLDTGDMYCKECVYILA